MNETLKKLLPHLIALVLMFVLCALFYSPYVFEGKVLSQHDITQAMGMQSEIKEYREQGEAILWTNSQFAGMPVYQIAFPSESNLVKYPFYYLLLKNPMTAPHSAAFLAMMCCYLLLIVLRVDWKLAIGGAVTFGLCTYNMDLLQAGHSTKMLAIAYIPAMFAGAVLAFRRKYWLGGALFGFAMALQIYANHLQITYYTGMLIAIYFAAQLVFTIMDEKSDYLAFAKSGGILALAALLAVFSGLSRLLTTSEYSKESQRGTSEVTGKDGLDQGYGLAYSLGITEAVFPTLVQNYFGGGNGQNNHQDTEYYQRAHGQYMQMFTQQYGMSAEAASKQAGKQIASQIYWGNDFTPGVSIYFGAVVWFLFIIGILLVQGPEKWWLLLSGIFMITISWGEYFFMNKIFFDYLPMFNKFRALSMAMGLAQVAFVALAFYGGQQLFEKNISLETKKKALYLAAGSLLGILVLMILASGVINMSTKNDGQAAEILLSDRASLLRMDVFRSLLFVGASAGLVWAYLEGKIKGMWVVIALSLLTMADMWLASKRIMNADRFQDKKEVAAEVAKRPADDKILSDPDPHYRVLDMTGGAYADAKASYFHKSIGGYNAAKMMLFEELKNTHLTENGRPVLKKNVLGMLNTKYVIRDPNTPAPLAEACGNAWFVDAYKTVPDAKAELMSVGNINPKKEAIVQQDYAAPLQGLSIRPDSNAYIRLTAYHPDKLEYEYSAGSEQLALFSEMYYPPEKGWNTYLDGEPFDPFIKANFAIRALRLPAGQKRKLEMRFEPRSYYMGEKFSLFGSLVLILGLLAAMVFYFRKEGVPDPNTVPDEPLPEPKKTVRKKAAPTQSKRKREVPKGDKGRKKRK